MARSLRRRGPQHYTPPRYQGPWAAVVNRGARDNKPRNQPPPPTDPNRGPGGPQGGGHGHGGHGQGGGGGQPGTPADTNLDDPNSAVPVPRSPESLAANAAADRDYQLAQAAAHRNLYEAALGYGDPTAIKQWSDLGYGPQVGEAPMSALSGIQRAEDMGRRNIRESENQGNTFFSGLHLEAQTKFGEQQRLARLAALQDYNENVAQLTADLARAQYGKEDVYGQTYAQDVADFMATEPEPKIPPGSDKGKPGTSESGGQEQSQGQSGGTKERPKRQRLKRRRERQRDIRKTQKGKIKEIKAEGVKPSEKKALKRAQKKKEAAAETAQNISEKLKKKKGKK